MASRISRPLRGVASGLEAETRARCQDDNHQPGCFNPWLEVTLCHCGRIWYPGPRALVRWPDRDARLTTHINPTGLVGCTGPQWSWRWSEDFTNA